MDSIKSQLEVWFLVMNSKLHAFLKKQRFYKQLQAKNCKKLSKI